MGKRYACDRLWCKSRIYLHVSLPVNNQSKVDVEIHCVAASSHAAQLDRNSGRVPDPAIVGAHIDVCYVVDTVADFDYISVANRIIPVSNIEVIPCGYPLAFVPISAWTLIQGRFIEADVLSNT